jgi:enoyl-CoA hydratase/carnithine racemase
MNELIKIERDGPVAILTLNNPPHNLLTTQFLSEYCEALEQAPADGARAILVKSDLRHFCAGADVEKLSEDAIDAEHILNRLESVPIPIVAALNGAVLGGGFEIALAADLLVAADSAEIGSVEVNLGLAPLLGAVQRLTARIGPARAKEITMLGRRYAPELLERWGVINLVVGEKELFSAGLSLAKQLGAGPTVAIGSIKKIANITVDQGVKEADRTAGDLLSPVWNSRDLKRGREAMQKTGPGTAAFEGN